MKYPKTTHGHNCIEAFITVSHLVVTFNLSSKSISDIDGVDQSRPRNQNSSPETW